MANNSNDFRDPKVTSGSKASDGGGIGKWIGIAIAALVVVLLLAWLFGFFADDEIDAAVVPIENGTTAVVPIENGAPVVNQ